MAIMILEMEVTILITPVILVLVMTISFFSQPSDAGLSGFRTGSDIIPGQTGSWTRGGELLVELLSAEQSRRF